MEAVWPYVEHRLSHLGPILGLCWAKSGPCWAMLDPSWAYVSTSLTIRTVVGVITPGGMWSAVSKSTNRFWDVSAAAALLGHLGTRCSSDPHSWHFILRPSGPLGFPRLPLPFPLPTPFFPPLALNVGKSSMSWDSLSSERYDEVLMILPFGLPYHLFHLCWWPFEQTCGLFWLACPWMTSNVP